MWSIPWRGLQLILVWRAEIGSINSTCAVEAKGMYKQRIRTAGGHAAHRGWARLLLDRHRDLIVHGPRTSRNAGGKFDDEEQQRHDGHHYHYPEQFHARASD